MTNHDDPKYTAYVLNELDDADHAAVEAEIQSDPEIAGLVADIRAATQQISAALAAEPLAAGFEKSLSASLPSPHGRGPG